MRPVKTHSLGGIVFSIEEITEINGVCDFEGKCLSILRGNTVTALGSLLEEGLHAIGIPDKYLHKSDDEVKIGESTSKIDDLVKLAWRLGWRRTG